MSLKGKVAIVTGGNSGIGQAIVLELARQQANVVIDYVSHQEATDALEQQISKLGGQSIGVKADASKLADLQMLVDKAVGEFGRSPKVNRDGGRDHWPHVQSVLLAGAGIPAGSVCGATDKHCGYPADSPVSPADLAATFLHLLGVPLSLELHYRTGRPLPACPGKPVRALLG